MSVIEDALWRRGYLRSGDSLTIIRKGPNGWQRAACPKCGYERAQVHHGRGLFWCPKVDRSEGKACLKVAVKQWSVVAQFAEMSVKVAGNASVRKYGQWLQPLEIASLCDELLLTYDRCGELDTWEADADGDADKLRSYVFTALRGDVLDYAKAKTRRVRSGFSSHAEYLPGDDALRHATASLWQSPALMRTGARPKTPGVVTYTDQDGQLVIEPRHDMPPSAPKRVTEARRHGHLTHYPTLAMRYAGMKVPHIAEVERVSQAAIRKRIQRETQRYKRRHGLT